MVVIAEMPVKFWLRRRGSLDATTTMKINAVNDWFIGQWQWLTGFGYFTCFYSLLTDSYFGGAPPLAPLAIPLSSTDCVHWTCSGFDDIGAWWAMFAATGVLMTGFIVGACHADTLILKSFQDKKAELRDSTGAVARAVLDTLDDELWVAMGQKLRVVSFKSGRWILWIALYFTLRKTFGAFDKAIRLINTYQLVPPTLLSPCSPPCYPCYPPIFS